MSVAPLSMEILGYIGALLIGIALGLMGGGGSILTMPILVYLFKVDAVLATSYSLFVVGITSLFGSMSHLRLGNIRWDSAILLGLPSIGAVSLTRLWVVPALPDPILTVGDLAVSKALAMLLFFALLMVAAAFSMISGRKATFAADPLAVAPKYRFLVMVGVVVGACTGLVGAGGGFLLVPSLVRFAKLPMKKAVGTSLITIAANTLIGFAGDLKQNAMIDWTFLVIISSFAIVGCIAGTLLSKRISNAKLKPAFGWFVLAMGIYILVRELSHLR